VAERASDPTGGAAATAPASPSADGKLTVDRLPDPADPVQVHRLDRFRFEDGTVREPHRHDYHELLWLREGHGEHVLDGRPIEVRPRSLTLIGRGQVHVFRRAEDVSGITVRFGDELLLGGEAQRATPGWLMAGRGGLSVEVPEGDVAHLEAVLTALDAEASRPPDARSAELERHLLSVLLLWVERWHEATRTERREADDPEVQLHRRFAERLEADYARHHDAAHYAGALGVPAAALSRALSQVTGRSTKELVTDRVMLEAARLLRFTDLTVQEVGHRTGFRDPLYFSRAFKRHQGEAPQAYRARVQGKSMDP
jgi:AraC family transcriptional regulator, transcriptional activator of pobA